MTRLRVWYFEILDEDGTVIDEIDPNDSCKPYEPNDRCGGCGECLLMQASHSGFEARAVPYPTAWERLNEDGQSPD